MSIHNGVCSDVEAEVMTKQLNILGNYAEIKQAIADLYSEEYELELYDEDIKNMRDIYATRKFDEKRGMEKGMEKGMAKEKIATAYRLLSMGLSEAQVATATELPLEEIQKMKE